MLGVLVLDDHLNKRLSRLSSDLHTLARRNSHRPITASLHSAINYHATQGMSQHDPQAHDSEQAQANQIHRYRRHSDRASDRRLRDRRLGFEQQQRQREGSHVRAGNIRAIRVG